MFRVYTDEDIVHSEPGEDKFQFSNDLADWMLARTGSSIGDGNGETRSKL